MGQIDALRDFVATHPRLMVLTGAGISTGSGITDYRDANGQWKRSPPMDIQTFRASPRNRARYWSRSMAGWPIVAAAQPNDAHRALVALEAQQRLVGVVTQNVDGLHDAAGQRRIVSLHGRLSEVVCLTCGAQTARADWQRWLIERNGPPAAQTAPAPDGDADVVVDLEGFQSPACDACGGVLKPDVVFFGESVPRARVERCREMLADADALLVLGSSLMVYSGFRFCRAASEAGKPVAIVNLGHTRADALAAVKLEADCGAALRALLGATPSRVEAALL